MDGDIYFFYVHLILLGVSTGVSVILNAIRISNILFKNEKNTKTKLYKRNFALKYSGRIGNKFK